MRCLSRASLIIGGVVGLSFVIVETCSAQESGKPESVKTLVKRMAEQIQRLSEDLSKGAVKSATDKSRIEESRELARSLADFEKTLGPKTEAFRVRRVYSGLDASWHHLSQELLKSRTIPPSIERAMGEAAETDLSLHRSLRVNDVAVYYGANSPTQGIDEVKRLSHAMIDRAAALAEAIRIEVPGPLGDRLMSEAMNLVQVAENYHQALRLEGGIDGATRNGFAPVEANDNSFEADLAAATGAPRTRAAWKSYKSAEILIRQMLNPPIAAPVVATPAQEPTTPPPTPTELANRLFRQASRFANLFGPTGNGIDEGPQFLDDARDLQVATARFRDEAQKNTNTQLLAFAFRDIDIIWLRLARRVNRMGQTQPLMDHALLSQMGDTLAELHRILGVTGYPSLIEGVP